MKTIQNEFRSGGFNVTVLKRHGDVVMLSKTRPSWDPTVDHLEVCLVRRHSGFTVAGHNIPPGEYLPANEEWGDKGWSFNRRADAEHKYADLIEAESDQPPECPSLCRTTHQDRLLR
jgi:hypothetical protein